jgi:hypothetical protein
MPIRCSFDTTDINVPIVGVGSDAAPFLVAGV